MLSISQVVIALQAFARETLPADVPVIWPGQQVDPETTPEWIQIECSAVQGLVQRDTPADRRDVLLTFQVFVRPSAKPLRVLQLAEQIRGALAGQTVLIEPDASDADEGAIRFQEAELRDLTSLHAESQRAPLRHVLVTLTGQLQTFVD